MEKLNGLITLLGEENEQKIKDKVTDLIIETVADDLRSYDECNYILNPEEVIEFVIKCKAIAFERVKEELVNDMMSKIKSSLQEK